MKIKTYQDVKNLSGYTGIYSYLKDNKVTSDIFFTELARVSKALFLNDDNIPCYQLIHLGGAFLTGEKYETDVIIEDNTHIILTSQSATKVNRTKPEDEPTKYNINIKLNNNSTIEFINDSIILYPEARYNQSNNFILTNTSTLIYYDIFSDGYSGHSPEKYLYDELFLNTQIFIDDKLILLDKLYFNPKLQPPNSEGIMNGFERCGNFLFISPLISNQTSQEIYDLVNNTKFKFKFEIGVSEFYNKSIGIRIIANETFEIQEIFTLIHNFIRKNYLHLESLKLRKEHA